MRAVEIETEFIKLDAFLKFAGNVTTGGEAKLIIGDGLVSLNGEICLRRGKKIYPGDVISTDGETYVCKKHRA